MPVDASPHGGSLMATDALTQDRSGQQGAARVRAAITGRRRRVVLGLPTLIGLVLGIVGGLGVIHTHIPQFVATSTFALLPQSTSSSAIDTGQLALLTPVYAAVVNDPDTRSLAAEDLGHQPAPVTSATNPNSDLVFTVTAAAPRARLAYATAIVYQRAITERVRRGDLVASDAVRLRVVTSATMPAGPAGLHPIVMLGAAAAGGLFVGLGIGLLLLRREPDLR